MNKKQITVEEFNTIALQKAKETHVTDALDYGECVPDEYITAFASVMHTWGYMSGWSDADAATDEHNRYMRDQRIEDLEEHVDTLETELKFTQKRLADLELPICQRAFEAQQERTWVGLTDEEKKEIYNAQRGFPDVCKAIEAKLKERNT